MALSRERPAEALRDTLLSNLEEMQRLAALVNDMLFLSQADRGAVARRGAPVQPGGAGARRWSSSTRRRSRRPAWRCASRATRTAAVDEPLVKRALSNLLGNAIRFAQRGSTRASCASRPTRPSRCAWRCRTPAQPIAPQHLTRLFDRFFRVDDARAPDSQSHHGLGLAIVAAIARMHAGRPLAESQGGTTRVGFTLVAH